MSFKNRYSQDVVAVCQQLAGGRYPFAASSMSDVTVQDFTQLFSPGAFSIAFSRHTCRTSSIPRAIRGPGVR